MKKKGSVLKTKADDAPATRADLAEVAEYIVDRIGVLEDVIHGIRNDLAHMLKRLDRIEADITDISGYAKEIDWMRTELQKLQRRVVVLEGRQRVTQK